MVVGVVGGCCLWCCCPLGCVVCDVVVGAAGVGVGVAGVGVGVVGASCHVTVHTHRRYEVRQACKRVGHRLLLACLPRASLDSAS